MRKLLLFTFLLLAISSFGQSNEKTKTSSLIKGRVIKENGEAYPNILVQNAKQITITDEDGWFAVGGKQGDSVTVLSTKYLVNRIPFILTVQNSNIKVIELKEVTVTGKSWQTSQHISINKEDIRAFRGTTNADIFNGTTGLQVNNIRNEAGAIDIGIRGLQGDGRVPILIDGGLQSTQTFRGYQGSSDRTYIEMDLIKKIDINKGASFSSGTTGATGGIIEMKTIGAEDVVLHGNKFGVYLKTNITNNSKQPKISDREEDQQHYLVQNEIKETAFNNLNATMALAYKGTKLSLLAAIGTHNQGNHFAGKNGADRYGYNPAYYDSLHSNHRENYKKPEVRPGQEVVNTSYRSKSVLVKLGWDIAPYQRLEANYRHHGQDAAEVLAAYWYKNSRDSTGKPYPKGTESMPQWSPGAADYNSYSLNYRYNPNTKINLQVSAYANNGNLKQRNGLAQTPDASFGDQYLHQFKNTRKGITILNSSTFKSFPLRLKYGMTIQTERLIPKNVPEEFQGSARNGKRDVYSAFIASYLKWKQFSVQGEMKVHHTNVYDYNDTTKIDYGTNADIIGSVTYTATSWLSLYGKASKVYRSPSLYESTESLQTFSYDKNYPLTPEATSIFELGLQTYFPKLFTDADTLTVGSGVFYNNTKKLISAAELLPDYTYSFINYDYYRLQGLEISLAYTMPHVFFNGSAILYKKAKVCSALLGESYGIEHCNAQGFDWSVLPNRIPPRRSFIINAGGYAFSKKLTVGGRLRYHSQKQNPKGWLQYTGAAGIAISIPADHVIDFYSNYQLNRYLSFSLNVDNLTDRYQYDAGSVIRMPVPGRTIRIGLQANF